MSNIIHASAVRLHNQAVMFIGDAASGKSSLALRLIDAHGAVLIGDDRLVLSFVGETIMVSPHDKLAGLLELRGLGLLRMAYESNVPLGLVVALQDMETPRLAESHYFHFKNRKVPQLIMKGRDPMSVLRIKYGVRALKNGFRDDAIYNLD